MIITMIILTSPLLAIGLICFILGYHIGYKRKTAEAENQVEGLVNYIRSAVAGKNVNRQ